MTKAIHGLVKDIDPSKVKVLKRNLLGLCGSSDEKRESELTTILVNSGNSIKYW